MLAHSRAVAAIWYGMLLLSPWSVPMGLLATSYAVVIFTFLACEGFRLTSPESKVSLKIAIGGTALLTVLVIATIFSMLG